jgi:hypothetical protein
MIVEGKSKAGNTRGDGARQADMRKGWEEKNVGR